MIEARNLKKIYETKISKGLFRSQKVNFEAVKDVSIKLNEGEIIGLVKLLQ